VSRVIVLSDQADGRNDDATVRRVGRSWQKRRELRVKISIRESNRLPRKALRVIGPLGNWEEGSQETERQRDGQREERCNDAE
jgi:hypothetical protein